MTTKVVEPSGAQILPSIADPRVEHSTYAAWTLCDADLRTKSNAHHALATKLLTRKDQAQ